MNDSLYRDSYQTVVGVRSTQVIGGHVGQLVIADEVVWQSEAYSKRDDGLDEARARLIDTMKELFA